MADKHGTFRATVLFSNNKPASGAFVSLVPLERQNKTYKGTANSTGEVEILRVKVGNYDIHVNALKNPASGAKESYKTTGLSIPGGAELHQKIVLNVEA